MDIDIDIDTVGAWGFSFSIRFANLLSAADCALSQGYGGWRLSAK